MQLVEIKEEQKDLWNRFIAGNNSECFLQSWQWGEFQKNAGRKIWRIAVIENEKILALAQIIRHEVKYIGNYLYCPRGPVVDKLKDKNEKIKILEYLFNEIENIAKMKKSVFLKIEPLTESDCELPKGFRKSNMDIQPKNTLMLDLSKSEEELLAGMKQKTRYNIRLAEKRGVKITSCDLRFTNHEVFEKRFEEFWKLTSETSRRDGFKSHDRDYYWKMMEVLYNAANEDKYTLNARLYLAEYDGKVISSNIVLFFSDFAVYLHGASSDEKKNVMAPYLLQWKQILDAQELGCKKYDFWGITVDGEKKTWKGITRFKKGFGGFEKRYSGSFDLVYDKMSYFGYGVIKKIRKIS